MNDAERLERVDETENDLKQVSKEFIAKLGSTVSEFLRTQSEDSARDLDEIIVDQTCAAAVIDLAAFLLNAGMKENPNLARLSVTNAVLNLPIEDQSTTSRLINAYEVHTVGELRYQMFCEAKERASTAHDIEREILAVACFVRLPEHRRKKFLEAFAC